MRVEPAAETSEAAASCACAAEQTGETATGGNTRRGMLAGAGLVGLAGLAAACGSGEAEGGGDGGSATTGGVGGGRVLAQTDEIPVGGGKIFKDEKIVVTQPAHGEFKAFSAVCTHAGCTVGSISGGTINCPCHGSKFKIADASPAAGPAKEALAAKEIKVEGDSISLV